MATYRVHAVIEAEYEAENEEELQECLNEDYHTLFWDNIDWEETE